MKTGSKKNVRYKQLLRVAAVMTSILTIVLVFIYGFDAYSVEEKVTNLEKEVRILCWVMTAPKNHQKKAVHVKRTWGKRCSRLIFVTTSSDFELGETMVLPISGDYKKLWWRTKAAFETIYNLYRHDYDWFMKADDDTYVFVENLRYMLYQYSPEMPIYFGYNFKVKVNGNMTSYMSGGAGYVLSRAALTNYGNSLQTSNSQKPFKCPNGDGPEDKNMGICLANAGVIPGDSRDDEHKFRFFPLRPYYTLYSYSKSDFWLYKHSIYIPRSCIDCLSKYMVSCHYNNPTDMHIMDYLMYNLSVYTPDVSEPKLPSKFSWNQTFLAQDN